ncbi:MAG: GTPase [Fuerstiella sp.]
MDSAVDSSQSFDAIADAVSRLFQGLQTLQSAASFLQPTRLEGQEWFELLRQKLVPQLGGDPWLVAAVVGGTNIGKSVTFNHLAGLKASSTSPMASGTKHPVCLVPDGFSERHDLQSIFPDFQLHEWTTAESALEETDQHDLFWRPAPELPSTLLVLDTPDIDSAARINWVRADSVRRSADVLIAVLTQQKYNDAVVKEFFRKAGAEGKSVMIVFNQCLLPEDEEYWPKWVGTFCEETGIDPDAVYLVPNDRRAADELRLPFYERPWPVSDQWNAQEAEAYQQARNLKEDLSALKFREIRLRTLRGSLLRVLQDDDGAETWLKSLKLSSKELTESFDQLSQETVLRIRDWPSASNSLFVEEIRGWWKVRQHGWAKRINGVYDTINAGVLWPFKAARNAIQGEPVPAIVKYRESEWQAILTTVEELFEKLRWMADNGNRMVRPRVESILENCKLSDLLLLLQNKHNEVDFEHELKDTVNQQLEAFSVDSPELFKMYRQLNNVTAVVRPMASVVLFSFGMGPAGEAVAPMVASTAANMVVHVATDVAGGTAAVVAGDTALSTAAGKSSGSLEALFYGLQSQFTERRVAWLTDLIHTELLGSLIEDMHGAADLPTSEDYLAVKTAIDELRFMTSRLKETA